MAKVKPPVKQKYIESPERMWELFLEYKAWLKANPIVVVDWVGGMGKRVERKKERPLTMEGFEVYCYNNNIINQLDDYFANRGGNYDSYSAICKRITKAIRTEQIEGGMSGIYNPSITQRLNGLVEKTENKDTVTTINVKRGDRHKVE